MMNVKPKATGGTEGESKKKAKKSIPFRKSQNNTPDSPAPVPQLERNHVDAFHDATQEIPKVNKDFVPLQMSTSKKDAMFHFSQINFLITNRPNDHDFKPIWSSASFKQTAALRA